MPRYEFSEGSSNKFWDIAMTGGTLKINFGKLGANGQTQLKELGSPAAAQKEYDRLVAEKTKKGYALVGGGKSVKAAKPAAKAAKPAAKAPPAKSAKSKPASTAGMYFEFRDGGSSKFWEITLAGTTVTTRYGKIGTDGQATPKAYKAAGEAKAEHDKLVAEKTKKGYKLVRGEAPVVAESVHARDAKLEALIQAAPDDKDNYLVYADWLQSQGDVRGELIALQAGGKDAPAKKLIAQNRDHFYGKLADALDMLERFEHQPLGDNTAWRWGYLEKLWISNKYERSADYGETTKPEIDVEDALGWLLDHPSSRFLRELSVGIVTYQDNEYGGIAKVIGKHALPTLKKLILGDFYYEETELNWSSIGDVTPIYKAAPNLESLTVRSGGIKFGKLELPKLRELHVITGELDKGAFKAIMDAKLPLLERITLQLGGELKFKVTDLQPIFDAKLFPKLKHLGLGNSTQGDEIAQAIASSKLAAQLESIDMSKGTMGDTGARALAAAKFPKLKTIDIARCYLTSAGINALKKLATVENPKDQKTGEDDDRYISGRE